jgi:hypothetical protein
VCTSVLWIGTMAGWLAPSPASAATISVAGLITVTGDYGASFKTGDTFSYSFTFDDQAVDTESQTFVARFNAAVSAFSLTAGGGNVGTWNPGAGTFSVSPVMNYAVNANSDQVSLQVNGTVIPDINGQPFFDVGLTFGFGGVQNFVDTGAGQTFAQLVGVSPLDFATSTFAFPEIRDDQFQGPAITATVTPVPEPASAVLALAGLACGGWSLFLRRRAR